MKLKGKLIVSMLGAAMLALPMTVPAFADPLRASIPTTSRRPTGGGTTTVTTATTTQTTVGIAGITNGAAGGIPANAPAVYRARCGRIGTAGILERLKTCRRKPTRRERLAMTGDSRSSSGLNIERLASRRGARIFSAPDSIAS